MCLCSGKETKSRLRSRSPPLIEEPERVNGGITYYLATCEWMDLKRILVSGFAELDAEMFSAGTYEDGHYYY